MRARPPARSRVSRTASSCVTVFWRPKREKHAARPRRTIHGTIARTCGWHAGLTSSAEISNPRMGAETTFACRKRR
jgi:hypothetical protein